MVKDNEDGLRNHSYILYYVINPLVSPYLNSNCNGGTDQFQVCIFLDRAHIGERRALLCELIGICRCRLNGILQ